MEGKILGNRYQLIERIGGGGMAIVYKAKCLLLNRYVAVKILRSEFTDDEEFVRRFRVEAQAAASLNHPNIVSIYDVGQQTDIHYIVMEYIDGITLKEYIGQIGALHWKEAVNIAVQICSAIEQAHKNHIVHRDIKPHNIMITKEGIAKVTDFGIARAVSSATITMVGSTIGSVHYFSPEQARGGFTDEKSDLYSLGITIYEMVTGKVPFDGDSPVAVALKHIQEKAERPVELNPSIPKGVNDLIIKAIKKEQNHRYQNATEMLGDLQRTLHEPNTKIAGSNIVEDLPTKKMQAVGAGLAITDDYEDGDDVDLDDDSDDMADSRKKDRLSVWLGIFAGLIIAGVVLYIGLKLIIPAIMPESPEAYVVEDFTKRNFLEVREELEKYGIKAVDNERIHNDAIEQDVIISQDVAVGNRLRPNSEIRFRVSDGPELVLIPDVSGKESREGEQIIKNLDLIVDRVTEYNDTVATDVIIKTEPSAFEKVKPKETVTVYVSMGPELEEVSVPSLLGLTRIPAEKLILENRLTIGDIIPADTISDVAPIIKQYPLAGSLVDEGTPVELTFGIEEQATPGQPNTTGHTDNEPHQTTPETTDTPVQSQPKTMLLTIDLDPNRSYDDEVLVYVEETPSDTNELRVVFFRKVAKDRFPFNVKITLAESGTTHIVVKLDGILIQEGDLYQ